MPKMWIKYIFFLLTLERNIEKKLRRILRRMNPRRNVEKRFQKQCPFLK